MYMLYSKYKKGTETNAFGLGRRC